MPFHIVSRVVTKIRRLVAEARWGLALCGRRVFTIDAFRRLQIVESISSRFLHRHIRPDQAIATVDGVSADDVARFKVSVVIPVWFDVDWR